MSYPLTCFSMCDTLELGYISRNERLRIPWATLSRDPSSWIQPECTPDGFTWKDPSKTQVEDVFTILQHWKSRQKNHLKPLIWVPSCPLLKDVGQQSNGSSDSSGSTDPTSEAVDRSSEDSSDTRSEDQVGTNSEDRDDATSEDGTRSGSEDRYNPRSESGGANSSSDNDHSDNEEEADYYMQSPPLPARYSRQGRPGMINLLCMFLN